MKFEITHPATHTREDQEATDMLVEELIRDGSLNREEAEALAAEMISTAEGEAGEATHSSALGDITIKKVVEE